LYAVRSEDNSHEDISWSDLANEIDGAWRGMMIAIHSHDWSHAYANFTTRQLTNTLISLAKNVSLPEPYKPLPSQRDRSHAVKSMHYRVFNPSNAQN
jgi:hypothetical protein